MIEPASDEPIRELRDHPDGLKAIVIRRSFAASAERVWQALTAPEQMIRWYLPLDGDLREGGYYVLVGNAVGEIRRCEPPRELVVSWVYGDFESQIGLRLIPRERDTLLELIHGPIPLDMVANPSPELWGLAVNWEMVLHGLGDFLEGKTPDGPAIDWMARLGPEERAAAGELARQINEDWVRVASG